MSTYATYHKLSGYLRDCIKCLFIADIKFWFLFKRTIHTNMTHRDPRQQNKCQILWLLESHLRTSTVEGMTNKIYENPAVQPYEKIHAYLSHILTWDGWVIHFWSGCMNHIDWKHDCELSPSVIYTYKYMPELNPYLIRQLGKASSKDLHHIIWPDC